ncbi:MAG: hypothetical protein IPM54_11535 [Polyangiaceae bacterium]|nr:hypothetical protein [Polyangiaceae bacterium]
MKPTITRQGPAQSSSQQALPRPKHARFVWTIAPLLVALAACGPAGEPLTPPPPLPPDIVETSAPKPKTPSKRAICSA